MSIKTYLIIFAILVGSTAFEILIMGVQMSQIVLIVSLVGSAGAKAFLIAMFFMHLKDEPKSLSIIVILPLIGAAILMTISMVSLMNSGI